MNENTKTPVKDRKKVLLKKSDALNQVVNLPYAFKIVALYELAIRNKKNIGLIEEVVDQYMKHEKAILHFISIDKEDSNFDDGGDNLFNEGRNYYGLIETKLIEQDIFPFQQYNEQLKKIYKREEFFDSKIFDVMSEIYIHHRFVQQKYGNTDLTVFNVNAETRIEKYLNKDSETVEMKYFCEDTYIADIRFNHDRFGYESTQIEVNIPQDTSISVYYSNASVYIEYVKTIDKDNLFYREVIECLHNYKLYELYKQLIQEKTYQALQSFLRSDGVLSSVKYKEFDYINDILPHRKQKNSNVLMRPNFLITSIEKKKINQNKLSQLYSIDSILLDEASRVEYDSVKFLFLKNLLKNPESFILDLAIYDLLEASVKKIPVTNRKVSNFLYEELIADNNLKIPKKTIQNNHSKMKGLIDSTYYRYF